MWLKTVDWSTRNNAFSEAQCLFYYLLNKIRYLTFPIRKVDFKIPYLIYSYSINVRTDIFAALRLYPVILLQYCLLSFA